MKTQKNIKRLKPIQFTAAGLEKVRKEYDALIASRTDAVATLKAARELGDLSENGLYKAARGRLSSLDNQIFRLETMIKLSKIEKVQKDIIGIGSSVTVHDGKRTILYTVVGGYESDPIQHKISHHSPIGAALMGKKVGNQVRIEVPAGIVTYTIIEIL